MAKMGDRAVVLGASIGGLLAARVLSDFFGTVTLVERDHLPEKPENRQGVPQGRHSHLLMRKGSLILSELFPGILDELTSDGAAVWDDGDLSKIDVTFGGHRIPRSGRFDDLFLTRFYGLTRPFLEFHVRQRVLALPNITTLQQRDVLELTGAPDRDRITGVRIANRYSGAEEQLEADLVVDATGRGSRTPVFLESLGYQRPIEEEVVVRVSYSSERYHLPPGTLHEQAFFRSPMPDHPGSMGFHRCEGDIWLLTVQGRMGHKTPTDHAGMLEFAAGIATDHIVAALHRGEPIGDVTRHGYQSNLWRRYDMLPRLPEGLLAIGDAICSFNPVYGQGMTIAAMDALVLRDCLERGGPDIPRRYFAATAKKINVAWQMSTGADLALPDVEAERPASVRAMIAYNTLVQSAAETDIQIAEKLWKVLHLVDPPANLMSPTVIARVALANLLRMAARLPTRVARLVPVGHRKRA
jgi:2-polyprenyl-6-methoxyphenol hydroxylase-like FAD-dependent oxidoreductase